MKARVEVAPQVESFVKAQAPEPRRRLTRAIKGLARNQGDTKALEGRLGQYSRLRVGGYRVLFPNGWNRANESFLAYSRNVAPWFTISLKSCWPKTWATANSSKRGSSCGFLGYSLRLLFSDFLFFFSASLTSNGLISSG